jgi:hypothetical protein
MQQTLAPEERNASRTAAIASKARQTTAGSPVPPEVTEAAPTFRPGTPTVMFELPPFYRSGGRIGRQWDIAPDGKRFLTMSPGDDATSENPQSRLVVVLNWYEERKRLVPAKLGAGFDSSPAD